MFLFFYGHRFSLSLSLLSLHPLCRLNGHLIPMRTRFFDRFFLMRFFFAEKKKKKKSLACLPPRVTNPLLKQALIFDSHHAYVIVAIKKKKKITRFIMCPTILFPSIEATIPGVLLPTSAAMPATDPPPRDPGHPRPPRPHGHRTRLIRIYHIFQHHPLIFLYIISFLCLFFDLFCFS